MKKIYNPSEFIDNNKNATIESYIEYLKKIKETILSKDCDNKDVILDMIEKSMKSVQYNLSILLISKMKAFNSQDILDEDNVNILYEINYLLELLKSTGMEYIPEELSATFTSKVSSFTSLFKTIKSQHQLIVQKEDDCQFLVNHTNSSELLRKAIVENDGLLVDTFGSMAEKVKPYYEAENRRVTQISMMIMFMKKLEDIQNEYYSVKNSTTNIFDKMKKEYRNSLSQIMERYNAVLQEAVDYFNSHRDILCVSPTEIDSEKLKIESFDDLIKAGVYQRLSYPSKSDFEEVRDLFREDTFCLAFNVIRQGMIILFKFERDEDGFYSFALEPEFRYRLLAAQRVLCQYFEEIYDRRLKREKEIKMTPKLSEAERLIYDRICNILDKTPSSAEEIIEGISKIDMEISRLTCEFARHLAEFRLLCDNPIQLPESFTETIDDNSDIESLFCTSLSKKKASDETTDKTKINLKNL